MKRLTILLIISFFIIGCEGDDLVVDPGLSTGSIDMTNYVALGNSLTAGYQSGALYIGDSQYGYAQQLAAQVGSEFVGPTVEYPGFGGFVPPSTIVGVMELQGLPSTIVAQTVQGDPAGLVSNLATAPVFHNLGIPGITTFDLVSATNMSNTLSALNGGSPNPLVDFVLRGSGNTPLTQAIAQQPTFVTLWIGNNDILGAVVRGDVIPGAMPTPTVAFAALLEPAVAALAGSGIDFVVANLPSVSSIPFANTVSPFVPGTGDQVLWAGITDASSLVLLSGAATLATGAHAPASVGGPGIPLPDEYFLDPSELAAINTAVTELNGVIAGLSVTYGFPVVDMNAKFKDVEQNGLVINGERFSAGFITGGLFSYDGVHPSSQGYSVLANEFIEAINSHYGATIPMIDVTAVPSLKFPALKGGKVFSYEDVYKNTNIQERLLELFPARSFQ